MSFDDETRAAGPPEGEPTGPASHTNQPGTTPASAVQPTSEDPHDSPGDTRLNILAFMAGKDRRKQPSGPVTPPRPPAPPGHITPYAAAAIEDECNELAAMPPKSGRNHKLNDAAFNLASLVYAGEVEEQYVRDRLLDACNANGLLSDPEDGLLKCEKTIDSGFRGAAAKVGARQIKPLEDTISPAAVFTPAPAVTVEDEADDEPKQPRTQQEWMAHILDAEEDFWQSRPSLQQIYDAALGRMCSPWAVLAHCAARALMIVGPAGYLPPLIGGAGSLNSFFAIIAPSGGGKSAAEDVSRSIIPVTHLERSLGSGEGLVESFFRPADKETGEPAGRYQKILFLVDESDILAALRSRSGATIAGMLRTAWSGKTLSLGYRGRTNEIIEAHSYRMCLIVAMQPAKAAWLLEDADGGTPQRFLWFPSTDPRISLDKWRNDDPQMLAVPPWREWEYAFEIPLPDEARELILSEREKAAQGQQDALDGHALFCREKFAYALAVLDNRIEMSSEDWRLAGIASEVSARTRAWVQHAVDEVALSENRRIGKARGQQQIATEDERGVQAQRRAAKLAKWVLEKLAEAGGSMTNRELAKACDSRRRQFLPDVLAGLELDGRIDQRPITVGRRDTVEWTLVGE